MLDTDVDLHYRVLEGGYPNRFGARIPIKSGWNLDKMQMLLKDYEDRNS